MPISVFIVEDSAIARSYLRDVIEASSGFELLGIASTPLIALKRMAKQWPDIILSGQTLAGMSGIDFLHYVQRNRPTPFVFLLSSQEEKEQLLAKRLTGLSDVLVKPPLLQDHKHQSFAVELLQRLKEVFLSAPVQQLANNQSPLCNKQFDLIAIGSSTGGTRIIEELLGQLNKDSPCVLVVQHMPKKFTRTFAQRLHKLSHVEVREAKDGDELQPGLVLIAPGGKHLAVKQQGVRLLAHVYDGALFNHHKPSVDILFKSLAASQGLVILAVLLTGMGKDGAQGMLQLKRKQAKTIALAEEDCVVYGMPKAAKDLHAITDEMTIDELKAEFFDAKVKCLGRSC